MPITTEKTIIPRSNEERSAQMRQTLLEATLDCMAENGYAATSTNNVVKRAGVSRGALVHHFPSKAALVAAAAVHLIRKRQASTAQQMQRLGESDKSFHDRIKLIREDYEKWFPANIEFMVAARTDPELRSCFANEMMPYVEGLTQNSLDPFPEFTDPKSSLMTQYVIGAFIRGLCLEGIVNSSDLTNDIFDEFVRIIEVWAQFRPSSGTENY